MRNVRKQLAQAAQQYDVEIWQSEWSMLGDGYSSSEFIGYDQATEMDIALYMSKVIHNDLTIAGVSSWSYWTSMDIPRWGHKNRFLLISLEPTLWVLGNYSLFIRPGYRRIMLNMNESSSFFGSAWISPKKDKIVAVYTNLSEKGVRLNEIHKEWVSEISSITTYTTTNNKNLQEVHVTADQQVIVPSESVTTVIYNLK